MSVCVCVCAQNWILKYVLKSKIDRIIMYKSLLLEIFT